MRRREERDDRGESVGQGQRDEKEEEKRQQRGGGGVPGVPLTVSLKSAQNTVHGLSMLQVRG